MTGVDLGRLLRRSLDRAVFFLARGHVVRSSRIFEFSIEDEIDLRDDVRQWLDATLNRDVWRWAWRKDRSIGIDGWYERPLGLEFAHAADAILFRLAFSEETTET